MLCKFKCMHRQCVYVRLFSPSPFIGRPEDEAIISAAAWHIIMIKFMTYCRIQLQAWNTSVA